MKKIFFILFSFILLFASCKQDEILPPDSLSADTKGEVVVRFSAKLPDFKTVTTRANGGVNNMFLLVFDEGGTFITRKEATLANQTEKGGEFTATLPASTDARTIHFICNLDWTGFNDNNWIGVNETAIIPLLSSSNPVFWTRHQLNSGINENSFDGVTIELLRNYAKVSVENNADNFTLEGFTIHNAPSQGTVAPFSKTARQFLEGTITEPLGLSLIDAQVENISLDEQTLFERRNKLAESITTVIVKGKFKGGNSTYYKIDLTNQDMIRYDIERNYLYNINIQTVAKEGFTNFNDALEGASHNSLFLDPIIEKYPIVSDGLSKLEVEETLIILTEANQPMNVLVKYYPDTNSAAVDNSEVTVTLVDNDGALADGSLSFNPSTGMITATAAASIPDADDPGVAVVLVRKGDLARTVRIILRPPFSFNPVTINGENPILLSNVQQADALLRFTIPDDVPEELFPLPVSIYAQGLYPAATGLQMFVERGIIRYEYSATSPGIKEIGFKTNNKDLAEKITLQANSFTDGTADYKMNPLLFTGIIRYNDGIDLPASAALSVSYGTMRMSSAGNYIYDSPSSGDNNLEVTISYEKEVTNNFTECYEGTTTLGALKTDGNVIDLTLKKYIFRGSIIVGTRTEIPNNGQVTVSPDIPNSSFVVSPRGKYTFTVPVSPDLDMSLGRTYRHIYGGRRPCSTIISLEELKTNPDLRLPEE